MVGGPPRVTWHITYDSLRSDGTPAITHSRVADYLNEKGYQVHLVWDPVTGDIIQELPADRGGAGLRNQSGGVQTNNMGEVNLQIEAYFTPGVVRGGVQYMQLTDTPMVNFDKIMSWADSWGIPRVAPLGPGDRNSSVWVNQAGHYGHFNVPENDHSDPVVSINDILAHTGSTSPPTQGEDQLFSASDGPTAHLIAAHSGLMVEFAGGEPIDNRRPIVVSLSDGGKDQRWTVVSHQDGTVTFVSRAGKAIDVPGNDATPGANVKAWDPNWSPAQRFRIEQLQPSLCKIVHAASGLVLDVTGGEAGMNSGRPLILWKDNGGRNQQFVYAPCV